VRYYSQVGEQINKRKKMKFVWTNKNFSYTDGQGNISHPSLEFRCNTEHEAMVILRSLVGIDLTNWTLVTVER